MNEKKRWLASNISVARPCGLDEEAGTIFGVSVNTIGEAKGHGVWLDKSFIETVKSLGNEKSQGVKARFGHPNMCSTTLGTFIGRFKNFRIEEDAPDQVKADLFLSNSAKETPHGNLHDYVIKMAREEPDMFGTSIVFTQGNTYAMSEDGRKIYTDEPQENEKLYAECKDLHACDVVDEPAANNGLFSRFSQESFAGQITEFLDLNPNVWEAVKDNKGMFEALAQYADNFEEFVNRYQEYQQQKESNMTTEPIEQSLEEVEPIEVDALESEEEVAESTEAEVAEPTEEAPEAEDAEDAEEELCEDESDDNYAFETEEITYSQEAIKDMVEEFGQDITLSVIATGGSIEDAKELYNARLIEENEVLRQALKEKSEGAEPAVFNAIEDRDTNKPKRLSDLWNKK